MIRAENSITLLLSTLQSTEGTLQTVNFWKGEVFRRNFATSGEDSTGIKIPDWVNERKYCEASLDYLIMTESMNSVAFTPPRLHMENEKADGAI